MLVSCVQPDAICARMSCIVSSFVMYVVDAMGDFIEKAYSNVGLLCWSFMVSLCLLV